MTIFDKAKLKQQRVRDQMMGEVYTPTPTFGESAALAWRETRDLELFTSDKRMKDRFLEPQKIRLRELRNSGGIPSEVWNVYDRNTRRGRRTDWAGLAEYANENLGESFDFSDESMAEVMRAESEQRQLIMSKADPADMIGAFGATAGAMLTDPFQVAAFAVPGTQMKFGGSAFATTMKMAFREGLVNVGVESVNQAHVMQFKESLGIDYGVSEGAANLLAAFTFGGVFGAGRAQWRIHTGDVNLADAIEAQDVLIKELSDVGPLEPTMRSVYDDIKLSQDVFKHMVKENPRVANMSVRDAYTEVTRQMHKIADTSTTAGSRATAAADADLEAAAHVTDDTEFEPGIDLESPLPEYANTDAGLVDTPRAPDVEGEPLAPRTFGEAIAEMDAAAEVNTKQFDDFWECMNG